MFKTAIKLGPLLFCCILVSFFFAIIQITVVHAATQQTQMPHPVSPTTTPTPTATETATPTPTPTPPATPGNITVTPLTVSAGNPITVTGTKWPAQQQLTVQISVNVQSGNIPVHTTVNTDDNGYFSTSLTIPSDTIPGTYQVAVYQPASGIANNTTFTVTSAISTATPSPTESPTATATVTPSTNNANGGGGGGLTILIFTLGTLGVLLIVIGVIMLAASSPQAQAR